MLGIDSPPLAMTSDGVTRRPCVVCKRKRPSSRCSTRSIVHSVRTSTPFAVHSSSSILTMSFEDSSQNNWPSSFSW